MYLDALTKEDLGADLVGICDMRADLPERIPRLRERHIPVYPTLEAFYAAAHADLPFSPHRCTFMRRWRFPASPTVPMCEKPLCLTVKEARAMAEGAARAGRFLSVSYQLDTGGMCSPLKTIFYPGASARPYAWGSFTVTGAAWIITDATTGRAASP